MENLGKKIAAGVCFALAGIGAAHAAGEYENPNNVKPRTSQEISLSDTANPEILATFEYKSNRPEPEYNGKTFTYNILSDNSFSQSDKPNAKFSSIYFFDIDGDGKFGDAEREAIKSGKLIYMHPQFNQIANDKVKNVFNDLISQREGLAQTLESERQAWETQEQEYENKLEEMSRQSPINLEPRVPQKQFEERMNEYEKQEQAARIDDEILNPENIGKARMRIPLSIIIGMNYSVDQNSIGGNLGLRLGYNENLLNIALLLEYQKGLSENSSTTILPTSPAGFYGKKILNEQDFQSFGIDGQVYLGDNNSRFILGGGYHNQTHIADKTAQTWEGDLILNSNNVSKKVSENIIRGYFGFDFNIADVIRPEFIFGLEVALESKKITPYLALRTTIAPPSKYGNR